MKTVWRFEFRDDPTSPCGFVAFPDNIIVKSIETKAHLDTPYFRMVIDTKERYLNYLFDKDRNFISWKQRKKEVEKLSIEVKTCDDGFYVERKREVGIAKDDEMLDGREYIIDMGYQNNDFLGSKREIEIIPIGVVCQEFRKYQLSRDRYKKQREENEKAYLDPKTPHKERLRLLYEEVSVFVAMYAYHPMMRDSDRVASLPKYEEYEKLFFSKVPDKEENYVEYLRAYCTALEENAVDEVEDVESFVKKQCKDAGLLEIYEKSKKMERK